MKYSKCFGKFHCVCLLFAVIQNDSLSTNGWLLTNHDHFERDRYYDGQNLFFFDKSEFVETGPGAYGTTLNCYNLIDD